jgi:hypothetical protein
MYAVQIDNRHLVMDMNKLHFDPFKLYVTDEGIGEGIGGRNASQIILEGSHRTRPWTSPARRSRDGLYVAPERQGSGYR